MLQLTADSLLGVNVHLDISLGAASNRRIWEIAGVGTCLLTDGRGSIEPLVGGGDNALVFETEAEAVELAIWAMKNPNEARARGRRAQKAVLAGHTYRHRAEELLDTLTDVVGIAW
jgi:spore maturation protein CgeB